MQRIWQIGLSARIRPIRQIWSVVQRRPFVQTQSTVPASESLIATIRRRIPNNTNSWRAAGLILGTAGILANFLQELDKPWSKARYYIVSLDRRYNTLLTFCVVPLISVGYSTLFVGPIAGLGVVGLLAYKRLLDPLGIVQYINANPRVPFILGKGRLLDNLKDSVCQSLSRQGVPDTKGELTDELVVRYQLMQAVIQDFRLTGIGCSLADGYYVEAKFTTDTDSRQEHTVRFSITTLALKFDFASINTSTILSCEPSLAHLLD
jgi:hypothetical protein